MQTLLSFILVFGIIVIVHEFGHFYFAKKAGILVREFSIGMGPKLFQTHKNETSYTIRVLPLGGYVLMAGYEEEEDIRLGMSALLTLDEQNRVTEINLSDDNIQGDGVPVDVLDYVAAVDCGTPINPNLARVQTEGGIAQGIGMALSEDVQYTDKGKIRNNSFMQYKIPTRQDIGNIRVAFESSYEKTGPFGAKSIGELVIDTPCPALAEAIYNATGVRLTELPMTPEKIAMGILKNKMEVEKNAAEEKK